MSPELQAFYNEYWRWLQAGAPDGELFYRNTGLCHAILFWLLLQGDDENMFILKELKDQFYVAYGKKRIYPFGGRTLFKTEQESETMHTNAERIEWVKKHQNIT